MITRQCLVVALCTCGGGAIAVCAVFSLLVVAGLSMHDSGSGAIIYAMFYAVPIAMAIGSFLGFFLGVGCAVSEWLERSLV